MHYDLLIKNATIVSMNENNDIFSGWIGIVGDTIEAVEPGEAPENVAETIIEATGCTVLPGLTDCHLHGLISGLNLCEVDLSECTSLNQVLSLLDKACEVEEDGKWVYGFKLLVNQLEEGRFPTRYELDRVSHGHKVAVFSATLHACSMNSAAIERVQIPDHCAGVQFDENGQQLGVYLEDESALTASSGCFDDLSEDEVIHYLTACCNEGLRQGATTLHMLVGDFSPLTHDKDYHALLEHGASMPLETVIWWQNWNPDEAKEAGLPRVGGCLTLDGATFELTQANYRPFAAAPHRRGTLYHTDDEVYRFISRAWELGLQPTMHAVGERAVDQLLYAYLRVMEEQGQKDLRPRLEHFCQSTDEQIALARKLGVTLSMQPPFSYYWDEGFREVLGEEMSGGTEAYGKVVSAGVTLLGGSDSPVAPINPLLGIATLVAGPDERRHVSVTDAIKAYTVNPAWSEFQESRKGSIEPGKVANLAIIDRNPYECDSKSIFEMNNLKTIYQGKVAYEAN